MKIFKARWYQGIGAAIGVFSEMMFYCGMGTQISVTVSIFV